MNNSCLYFIIPILIILFLGSCENEQTLIGEEFLNTGSHEVFIVDDSLIRIIPNSKKEESLTANGIVSLLGSYIDPVFGHNQASFCFKITLPNNEMSFDVNSIKNAKLKLPYAGLYGDTLSQLLITISQLNDTINTNTESVNLSNTDIPSTIIADTNISVKLSDIVNDGYLELNLPSTFILNEILNLNAEELANTNTFIQSFRGLKLNATVTEGSGGIVYFNTASDNAYLNIEYLNTSLEEQSINFPINGDALNHFQHNYENSNIEIIDTLVFLQSMGGVLSELDFSFLNDFRNSGYIVNDAILNLSVFNNNDGFEIPKKIQLFDFNMNFLNDASINEANNMYEFNITQAVQNIITDLDTPVLKLYTSERASNAERVILSNTNNNPIELKLVLIKN